MWLKRTLVVALLLVFSFTSDAKYNLLRQGQWRGVLQLNDSTELPFTFEINYRTRASQLVVINSCERIITEYFHQDEDSIWWTMPVFNTMFRCKKESDTTFSGEWSNTASSKPYILKFRAVHGKPRFDHLENEHQWLAEKWECTFSPGSKRESKAIGLFKSVGSGNDSINGTFLTEFGDYRFLEGVQASHGVYSISCFDGQFAFLFTMKLFSHGDSLKGEFWSGKYGYEPWVGVVNDKFELRDPDQLTFAKDSTDVNFTFNDLNGKPVSLSDYRGKVVIVQILGTWCPNCLDETAWMQQTYTKYNSQGLEIIGLAYERKGDTATQNAAIRRIRDRYGVTYTLLNTGKSGKDSASASLPFLSGIFCFPTTIYIDKAGNVRRIHSGYNGPATGVYYDRDNEEALRLIQQLLAEKPKQH